jgi:hypothetical protein
VKTSGEFTAKPGWIIYGVYVKGMFSFVQTFGISCISSFDINRYDHARQIKEKQDSYCEKALAGQWSGLGDFPEDLQWEALADVLRGKVKVQNHCYGKSEPS